MTAATATGAGVGHDRISGQWTGAADRMRRRWHKLTRNDVVVPAGSAQHLAALLQKRYGVGRRGAPLQVYGFDSEL